MSEGLVASLSVTASGMKRAAAESATEDVATEDSRFKICRSNISFDRPYSHWTHTKLSGLGRWPGTRRCVRTTAVAAVRLSS